MKPDFNLMAKTQLASIYGKCVRGGDKMDEYGFMSETFRDMAMLDAHLYLAIGHAKKGDMGKVIRELMFARELIGFPRFTSRLTNDPKEIEKILSRFNSPEVE